MSFLDQYAEEKFTRTLTAFTKQGGPLIESGSSKQNMGSSFILLNAKAAGSLPCRLRLYGDQNSRDIDANRPTGSFNLSESVALIADIVLSSTNTLNFDPPLIGTTENGNVYWTLNTSTGLATTINVTSYPIEKNGGTGEDRTSLIISRSNIPTTGYGVSGSISCPKSFIILSGSATSESRLRLYSRPYTEIPESEMTRSFGTQSQDDSLLIADLMFDSGSFQYPFVPVLEAYTWKTTNYSIGNNQIGYILENRSPSTTGITASLYLYETES